MTLGEGEDVNESRIVIRLAPGTTLGDIESLSWWVNTTTGYPPHADLLLDLDGDGVFDGGKKDMVTGETLSGDDDVLVAEFAYQPYTGPGYEYVGPGSPYGHYNRTLQGSYYNPSYDVWVQTFQNETSETGTLELYNETVCWLYSGLPGPYNDSYFGKLEDFKEESVQIIGGTEFAPVNSSVAVLEIHIEVDNWLGSAMAYVDDVALNGEPVIEELQPPEIEVARPRAKVYPVGDIPVEVSTNDLFGVDRVWFNLKNGSDDWVYIENQTYTAATYMSGLGPGDYTFHAWANNTLGATGSESVSFTVAQRALSVEVHPQTLNLKSRGRWVTVRITPPEGYTPQDIVIETVKLHIGNVELEAEWGRAGEDCVMVKFSRSDLQEFLEPGEDVELTVTGELTDGTDFGSTDTIRVINPPSGKHSHNGKGPKNSPGNGNGKKNGFNWSHRWTRQGNGKSKGNKGGKGKGKP